MAVWDNLTGLTGDPVHAGSWSIGGFKLPDIGLTEKAAQIWGTEPHPYTGGSQLVGGQLASPVSPQQLQGTQPISVAGPVAPAPSSTYQAQAPAPAPSQGQSQLDQLIGAMVGRGYDPVTARAVATSNFEQYWQEYMGGALTGGGTQQAIEDIYGPAMESLSGYEQRIQERYPLEQESLRLQQEQLMRQVRESRVGRETELAEQTRESQAQERSALAQARQLYNELTQGIVSRFGAGTSTGPAASELLSRATTQTIGGIQEEQATNMRAIRTASMKLHTWAEDEKLRLTEQSDLQKQYLEQSFKDELSKIQAQRNTLESAKAAARLDLLNQYRQQVYALDSEIFSSILGVDSWANQQRAVLTQQFGNVPTGLSPNALAQYQKMVGSSLSALGQQFVPTTPPTAAIPTSAALRFAPTTGVKLPGTGEELTEEEIRKLWGPYQQT